MSPTRPGRRRSGDPLTGHTDAVWSVAFAPDGHTLATGSADNTVLLWDVADPARPRRLGRPADRPHRRRVRRWRSPRTGTPWPPAAPTTRCCLWDVADPARPRRLGRPADRPHRRRVSVAFAPDGHTLATGSVDNTVILWDVADPARPRRSGDPLTGHTGAVSSVAFAPDGHTLATGSADQTVMLWDVRRPDPAPPARASR